MTFPPDLRPDRPDKTHHAFKLSESMENDAMCWSGHE